MGRLSKEITWVKVTLALTGYILWLLENCVKYMTKNAYIQVALQNTWFFPSAWNAFCLVLKNAHRFGWGAAIGSIYNFFGCILILTCTSGCSYLALTNFQDDLLITSPIPATVIIAIVSGTIAFIFMSIFSFSSDAIL